MHMSEKIYVEIIKSSEAVSLFQKPASLFKNQEGDEIHEGMFQHSR